ncbi:MAG: site-2 protease family protein [Alphaproteobacteria bacterium]|nr:site-2 protease family protein [Alphaproteobacteria bacterium]
MDLEFIKIEYVLGPFIYILLIYLAVLLHECGHYIAARIFGMPIKEVVIGRGRTLKWWIGKDGTRFSFRLWPLGAYVHLLGAEEADHSKAYALQPYWKRMTTTLAGPFINIAVLPFLFFAFYLAFGQPSAHAVLVGVEEGMPAEEAGFEPWDEFLSVNGIPVTNYLDMQRHAYSLGPVEATYKIRRGDEIKEITFTPGWDSYMDDEGILREHTRFGVTWYHRPYQLAVFEKIAGVDVSEDPDRALELINRYMGQEVTVVLKGQQGRSHAFKVRLSEEANKHLNDPDHRYYEEVFLGKTKGNYYQEQPVGKYALEAFMKSADLIKIVAVLPFQLLPIDASALKDQHAVAHIDTVWLNRFYNLIYLFATASVAVALINMLPLPGTDGGQFLVQMLEHIKKEKLTRRTKARIFGLAFFVLYMSILFSNLDNLPAYVDSRVKKVQEFINPNQEDE